ncbi:MAG: glycerol kinase [Lentisphaerae bacterium]|nr:glycerol kinase [Lentisphaerota bacterium]MCP4101834.1 glycerol kinase [Lentisphaerota bacterium]
MDSWLLFKLTGVHATEPSNASMTMLYNIKDNCWDSKMLELFGIPENILPEIRPSIGDFGKVKPELFNVEIPVCSMLGDQQAAMFGQNCTGPHEISINYGTGCFASVNTGKTRVKSETMFNSLVAWKMDKNRRFLLNGGVLFGGAAIQWLCDKLHIIDAPEDSEDLAKTAGSGGDILFIPAFFGLGAPYGDSDIRGTILGIDAGCTLAHLARAALEGIAYRCAALFFAMEQETGNSYDCLKASGSASENSFMMQFQADILGIPVIRSQITQASALGVALAAGKYCGVWENFDKIYDNLKATTNFYPRISAKRRVALLERWRRAVEAAKLYKASSVDKE